MMFFCAFFQCPVQVCWNVFQSNRSHFETVMVPLRLSTKTPHYVPAIALLFVSTARFYSPPPRWLVVGGCSGDTGGGTKFAGLIGAITFG